MSSSSSSTLCLRCSPSPPGASPPAGGILCPSCITCVVCAEEITPDEYSPGSVLTVISAQCRCHGCSSCTKCWRATATSNVLNGSIDRVTSMNCGAVLADRVMEMLLEPELFSKVLGWRMKRLLESMPGVRTCPNPACEATYDYAVECVEGSRPCRDVGCGACGMRFCFDCHEPVVVSFADPARSHLGLTCAEFERVKDGESVEDVVAGAAAKRWTLRMCLDTFTKPCVRCNRRIEKNGGCNWVACTTCEGGNFSFCWMCRATHEDNARHVTCYDASQRELQLIAEILAIPEERFAEQVPAKLDEFRAFLADFPAKEAEAVKEQEKANRERAERLERQRLERIAAQNALPDGFTIDLFSSATDVTIVVPEPAPSREQVAAERARADRERENARRREQRAERQRRRQAEAELAQAARLAQPARSGGEEEGSDITFDLFSSPTDVVTVVEEGGAAATPAPAPARAATPTLLNMLFVPRRQEDPMWAMNAVPHEGVLDDLFHSYSSPALMAMA